MIRIWILGVFVGLALVFSGCTQDSYKSGDGDYSYLRGDFSLLRTNSEGRIVSFETDDNRSFYLNTPMSLDEIKADTTYRALVYYDETESSNVDLRGYKFINVCIPFQKGTKPEMKIDPTGWESMWLSTNRKFLNLALNLLTGVSDDDEAANMQILGVQQDTIVDRHTYYTLFHDQNGIPEYYTTKVYFSIPLTDSYVSGDTITMTVNTYDGVKSKTIVLP